MVLKTCSDKPCTWLDIPWTLFVIRLTLDRVLTECEQVPWTFFVIRLTLDRILTECEQVLDSVSNLCPTTPCYGVPTFGYCGNSLGCPLFTANTAHCILNNFASEFFLSSPHFVREIYWWWVLPWWRVRLRRLLLATCVEMLWHNAQRGLMR